MQKKSGLTLALSGTVGSAINNAVTSAQDTKEESDGRLKTLQATKTVLSGVQAGQAAEVANLTADPNAMGSSFTFGSILGSQHNSPRKRPHPLTDITTLLLHTYVMYLMLKNIHDVYYFMVYSCVHRNQHD